jgi:hypothetical protein
VELGQDQLCVGVERGRVDVRPERYLLQGYILSRGVFRDP